MQTRCGRLGGRGRCPWWETLDADDTHSQDGEDEYVLAERDAARAAEEWRKAHWLQLRRTTRRKVRRAARVCVGRRERIDVVAEEMPDFEAMVRRQTTVLFNLLVAALKEAGAEHPAGTDD